MGHYLYTSSCFLCLTQTFKFRFAFFSSNPGHVVLLRNRLGKHALQPLQRGLALLSERRQAFVTGVEGRDVGVTVLWKVEEKNVFR